MKVLSIDIGTYSIKIQESIVEKKKFHLEKCEEIIISQVKEQLSPELSDLEVTQQILEEIFERKDEFDKITYQLPSQYIITRFLNLPVKTRKKAQQILPFQLEDGLFSDISATHYITKFITHKSYVNAQTYIARADLFSEFYELHKNLDTLPNTLVSEQTLHQDYIEHEEIGLNYAILDIGHTTTKAYIISNNEVISNHLLYFGGANITKLIAETYQISLSEAEIYKRENAFLLTENQYTEVEEDQQEFARFMQSAFNELIKNFQIWDLGHQSITGKPLNKIYITGGTSKIKNITNFLSQSLHIKCDYLPPCKFLASPNSLDEFEDAQYQNVTMMTSLYLKKSGALNFLHGSFAGSRDIQLPLYTISFIGSRLFYISLIISVALLLQFFKSNSQLQTIQRKVVKTLKSPSLGLKRKDRRLLNRSPQRLLRTLKKKEKVLDKTFSSLYKKQSGDIFAPLTSISKAVSNSNSYVITHYRSTPFNFSLKIKPLEDSVTLDSLEKELKQRLDSTINIKKLGNYLQLSN